MNRGVALLLALAVTGCTGAASPPFPPQTPTRAPFVTLPQAKEKIIADRARIWKDPYSIRDAKIGQPIPCMEQTFSGDCVCVIANAKNAMGGYTGLRRTLVIFISAYDIDLRDGALLGYEEYCGGTQPFPEINEGYQPPRAAPKKRG